MHRKHILILVIQNEAARVCETQTKGSIRPARSQKPDEEDERRRIHQFGPVQILLRARTCNSSECEEKEPSRAPLVRLLLAWEERSLHLSVCLGNALNLILLLDGIRVLVVVGCIDQLIRQAFRDGLDVAESGVASASGEQVDSLVDTAERGHIDGLTADDTARANARAVLAGARLSNGVSDDLQRVGTSHEVDDLASVLDDLLRHLLLSVVAAMEHHGGNQTLNNGALHLAERLSLVASSSVGQPHGELSLHTDEIDEGHIGHLDILSRPASEDLDLGGVLISHV